MANPVWGIIALVFVFFCACCFAVIKGFMMINRKRLIQNMPTSTVRSIAMGLVELKGKAVAAKETLTAPFSAKKCFRYWWIVEERREDKDGHEYWRTISSGSEGVPFYLQDATGKVLISAEQAELDMPSTFQAGSGIGREPPPVVKQWLEKKGIKWSGWIFNKPLRYRESAIEAGSQLYIMGDATTNPDAKESTDHTQSIIIKKGGGKIFYISTRDEKQITRGLAIGGVLAIIFGCVFGLGTLLFVLFTAVSLIFH